MSLYEHQNKNYYVVVAFCGSFMMFRILNIMTRLLGAMVFTLHLSWTFQRRVEVTTCVMDLGEPSYAF